MAERRVLWKLAGRGSRRRAGRLFIQHIHPALIRSMRRSDFATKLDLSGAMLTVTLLMTRVFSRRPLVIYCMTALLDTPRLGGNLSDPNCSSLLWQFEARRHDETSDMKATASRRSSAPPPTEV